MKKTIFIVLSSIIISISYVLVNCGKLLNNDEAIQQAGVSPDQFFTIQNSIENEQKVKSKNSEKIISKNDNQKNSGQRLSDNNRRGARDKKPLLNTTNLQNDYNVMAMAIHFVTLVYKEPDTKSLVLGYLRRGNILRVKATSYKKGCSSGWYEILGGGYVCKGNGIFVREKKEDLTFEEAPERLADTGQPLPYVYGYVTAKFAPEYLKIPGSSEQREAQKLILKKEQEAEKNQVEELESRISADPDPQKVQSEENNEKQENNLPDFLHQILAKGFFVSIDKIDSTFTKTIRGRYLSNDVYVPWEAKNFEGVKIKDKNFLSLGILKRGGVKVLQADLGSLSKKMHIINELPIHQIVPYLGMFNRENTQFVYIGRGEVINRRSVSIIKLYQRPQEIGENQKWIDVNLTEQTLVAYEGDVPIFSTLISSGRKDDDFPSPTGIFKIESKHVTVTMDDPQAATEAYSIEDVPWTMYFHHSFALHGAFWHNRFGNQRSHGCINLSPQDARWLFFWADPGLPSGWHGVYSSEQTPGTWVVIHE